MNQLSIIIVHCARSVILHEGHRLELFPNCVRSIEAAAAKSGVPCELVVADWKDVPHEMPVLDWIFDETVLPIGIVPMTGEFSKGRGCNAAAEAAKNDFLFFCDADMIVSPDVLSRGMEYLEAGKAWFPGYLAERGVGGSFKPPNSPGTGNAFMTRAMWIQCGKWPEQTNWGSFDRPISTWFEKQGLSAEPIATRDAVPGFLHQWHPKFAGWKSKKFAGQPATEVL